MRQNSREHGVEGVARASCTLFGAVNVLRPKAGVGKLHLSQKFLRLSTQAGIAVELGFEGRAMPGADVKATEEEAKVMWWQKWSGRENKAVLRVV